MFLNTSHKKYEIQPTCNIRILALSVFMLHVSRVLVLLWKVFKMRLECFTNSSDIYFSCVCCFTNSSDTQAGCVPLAPGANTAPWLPSPSIRTRANCGAAEPRHTMPPWLELAPTPPPTGYISSPVLKPRAGLVRHGKSLPAIFLPQQMQVAAAPFSLVQGRSSRV